MHETDCETTTGVERVYISVARWDALLRTLQHASQPITKLLLPLSELLAEAELETRSQCN